MRSLPYNWSSFQEASNFVFANANTNRAKSDEFGLVDVYLFHAAFLRVEAKFGFSGLKFWLKDRLMIVTIHETVVAASGSLKLIFNLLTV